MPAWPSGGKDLSFAGLLQMTYVVWLLPFAEIKMCVFHVSFFGFERKSTSLDRCRFFQGARKQMEASKR